MGPGLRDQGFSSLVSDFSKKLLQAQAYANRYKSLAGHTKQSREIQPTIQASSLSAKIILGVWRSGSGAGSMGPGLRDQGFSGLKSNFSKNLLQAQADDQANRYKSLAGHTKQSREIQPTI